MKIDLLNAEAFSNMAFEQMHNTYMLMREERKKTLEKVRHEAIEQLKATIIAEINWWQVKDFEGTTLGYGYGTAKAVCNLFAYHDYKDCYDLFWVKKLPIITIPVKKELINTECKYKVVAKMQYDWNIDEFRQLEEELKRKKLVLPEVK